MCTNWASTGTNNDKQRQYTRTGTFRWRETGAWANARIFLRGRLVQLHRRREIYAWPLNSFPRTCCRSPHFKRVRLRKFLFAMNAALRLRVPLIAKILINRFWIDFERSNRAKVLVTKIIWSREWYYNLYDNNFFIIGNAK